MNDRTASALATLLMTAALVMPTALALPPAARAAADADAPASPERTLQRLRDDLAPLDPIARAVRLQELASGTEAGPRLAPADVLASLSADERSRLQSGEVVRAARGGDWLIGVPRSATAGDTVLDLIEVAAPPALSGTPGAASRWGALGLALLLGALLLAWRLQRARANMPRLTPLAWRPSAEPRRVEPTAGAVLTPRDLPDEGVAVANVPPTGMPAWPLETVEPLAPVGRVEPAEPVEPVRPVEPPVMAPEVLQPVVPTQAEVATVLSGPESAEMPVVFELPTAGPSGADLPIVPAEARDDGVETGSAPADAPADGMPVVEPPAAELPASDVPGEAALQPRVPAALAAPVERLPDPVAAPVAPDPHAAAIPDRPTVEPSRVEPSHVEPSHVEPSHVEATAGGVARADELADEPAVEPGDEPAVEPADGGPDAAGQPDSESALVLAELLDVAGRATGRSVPAARRRLQRIDLVGLLRREIDGVRVPAGSVDVDPVALGLRGVMTIDFDPWLDGPVEADGRALVFAVRAMLRHAVARAHRHVIVSVRHDRGDAVIEVDDDGGAAWRDTGSGFGLGLPAPAGFATATRTELSIALVLAEQVAAWHGGGTTLEESPLGGCRLTLRWPAGAGPEPEPEPDPAAADHSAAPSPGSARSGAGE